MSRYQIPVSAHIDRAFGFLTLICIAAFFGRCSIFLFNALPVQLAICLTLVGLAVLAVALLRLR